MIISSVKTEPITSHSLRVTDVIDRYVQKIPENSVFVITSKVVSLCEGRVIPLLDSTKNDLAVKEADYYIPAEKSKYHRVLTIKHHALIMSAGVDSRNTHGYFVLLPTDPQKTAEEIWNYIKKKFGVTNVGVIITDSHSNPLRSGVTGFALSYCGFKGYKEYFKQPDIFGADRTTTVDIADSLAVSAVLVMGEMNELTPIGIVENIPRIEYSSSPPTKEELERFFISRENDIFAPFFASDLWVKGQGGM